MNMSMKPLIDEQIKEAIEETATMCLNFSGDYRIYDDIDLMNVVLIFSEVFTAKTFEEGNRKKLTQVQLEENATRAGLEIRDVIQKYTGIDLHKVLK